MGGRSGFAPHVVDNLAGGADLLMGETDAGVPLVIIRDAPNLTFTTANAREVLFALPAEDYFRVLYERFL